MENELSEELSNDIRAAFNLFDTEQRGKIDASNLGAVCVAWHGVRYAIPAYISMSWTRRRGIHLCFSFLRFVLLIVQILRCCGLQPTEVQLRRQVASLGGGKVTLGQVISVAESFQDKRVPKAEIQRVYKAVFDADGRGIDPRALMAASRNMNEKPLSMQEAEQMVEWLQKPEAGNM